MSEIAVYIDEILLSLSTRGLLWPAIFACFIVLLPLIWLLSRSPRLWYWKVNAQADTLKSIDLKLQQLGNDFKENVAFINGSESGGEAFEEELEIEEYISEPAATVFSVGRSGKVYTEEELDELIKE